MLVFTEHPSSVGEEMYCMYIYICIRGWWWWVDGTGEKLKHERKSGSTKWTYLYRTMSIGWCEIAKRCTTLLNIGPCSNTSLSVCLCFFFYYSLKWKVGHSFVILMHKQINSRYYFLNFKCFVFGLVELFAIEHAKKKFIRCCTK